MTLIMNSPVVDGGHEDAGHPERPERLIATLAGVGDLDLGDDLVLATPYSATRSELARVHDPEYLDRLGTFCYEGGGALDADTYATYDSWSIAQLAASEWPSSTGTSITGTGPRRSSGTTRTSSLSPLTNGRSTRVAAGRAR